MNNAPEENSSFLGRDIFLFALGAVLTAVAVEYSNELWFWNVVIYVGVFVMAASAFDAIVRRSSFHRKRRMLSLIGMIVCAVGFFGFFIQYIWKNPIKVAAVTSAPSPSIVQTPANESLPGFAFSTVFSMRDMAVANRQYLFEYQTPEGAKVAFYISKSDRFTFLATDRNGESYPIEVPLGKDGIPINQPIFLYCDVGSGSNYSFMRVFVNGKQVERRDFQFPIDMGSRRWTDGTLGANLGQTNNASFAISEIIMWASTLNSSDLSKLTQNTMSDFDLDSESTNLLTAPPPIQTQK